jgi:hypothetical protein
MKKAQRRSAKEWARLVGEWERSGQGAEQFGSRRGLRPQTLVWWRWRLGCCGSRATKTAAPHSVGLVRVQVQESSSAEGAVDTEGEVGWELVSPSGHVLRVYGRESQLLGEALAAVMGRGRRA